MARAAYTRFTRDRTIGRIHRHAAKAAAATAIASQVQRAHGGSPPGTSQCSTSTPTSSQIIPATPAESTMVVRATPLTSAPASASRRARYRSDFESGP